MGKTSPSPSAQATQQRRLSTKMKPKLKVGGDLTQRHLKPISPQVKSPDVPPSKSRRGQNSNPCTGSLILGSLILGSSVP